MTLDTARNQNRDKENEFMSSMTLVAASNQNRDQKHGIAKNKNRDQKKRIHVKHDIEY